MSRASMKYTMSVLRIGVAASTLTLFGLPVFAQRKVPDATIQEILIKTSLLTFNDANITGNYQVMYARMAKSVRDQIAIDRFVEAFKPFHDHHVFLDLIAAKPPVTEEAKVDNTGRFTLKGHFDTSPSRVYYDLAYISADDEWQLVQITVNLKKPDGK
jgi:hypothetical protein